LSGDCLGSRTPGSNLKEKSNHGDGGAKPHICECHFLNNRDKAIGKTKKAKGTQKGGKIGGVKRGVGPSAVSEKTAWV